MLNDALVKGMSLPAEPLPASRAGSAAHRGPRGELRTLPKRDVRGRWRIVEMDLCKREVLDLVEPAFIEFAADRTGSFGFIAVTAWMDCRRPPSMGEPVWSSASKVATRAMR